MLLAWQRAKQWQGQHCMTPFEDLIGWHLSCGLVHSTPSVFLLAHEVAWDAQRQSILPATEFPANAWFVTLAAASGQASPLKEFLRIAPHPHRYALWCRRGTSEIHAFTWGRLQRKF